MTQYVGPPVTSVRYYGRMYRSAAQTHNSGSGTFDTVEFDTVEYSNINGMMDTSNNRVNMVKRGIYHIRVHCEFSADSSGNHRELQLVRSGGQVVSNETYQNTVNIAVGLFAQVSGPLGVGQYIYAEALQNSGGNLAFNVGTESQWMEAMFLGP